MMSGFEMVATGRRFLNFHGRAGARKASFERLIIGYGGDFAS
jgi:hypothetical protein